MTQKKPYDPEVKGYRASSSFLLDIAPLVLTAMILMVQFFIFKDFTPHIPLACGILITAVFMAARGRSWEGMESRFLRVIKVGLPAIIILMGVGMLVGSWIIAGTVPTILYYGFEIFSPSSFLASVCIICALISIATGSSWGTVGTVGLALMGIGTGLGIPPELTGGAIVSGAFFGDKMSPLSDTTNLTPAASGIDIWEHIKGMLPTTLPAFVIALGLYIWIGLGYSSDSVDMSSVELLQQTMAANYNISLITLLPALVVIAAAVMQFPAIPTVLIGVFVSSLIAFFLQGVGVHDIFVVLQDGYVSKTGVEMVDQLLTKGGVMSMTWVVTLTIFALAFVGSLEHYGTLKAIMAKLNKLIKGRFGLVGSTYAIVLSVGTIIGDVYTTLVLPGRLLKDKYKQMGYKRTTLTRSIEDCGTLLSPLIPWNMGGSFVAATLGAATITYAPYAFVCWISPLIGLLWLILNKFIPREAPQRVEAMENLVHPDAR
ncbi:Na+/H+ antiporter NhaC [Psychrobacter sanguinis]|mgnify:CR=1 FL=1|uniref:Na+/H+ antiporter NhaC n=1 Tax=Psychrobacter sanguinis TaxID=861445 RepID=UPI00191A171A|nr:Na+/H+ antiporter NhaC [Psychrobacter sanguinis]MCC3307641.1 Na+/H+ antiporter NhaC [Psychrobacter sanguinis]MDN5566873.1 Na+/H+ antiporter NhaC [Psychrobacter sp.]UEC24968.1 Na+/H+ antiporter NhaC [Psychrobacter sanguinis]